MSKEEKKSKVKLLGSDRFDNSDGATIDISRHSPISKTKSVKVVKANSLSKQRIDKLFRMFCIHRDNIDEIALECSDCLLREIPWNTKNNQAKDLCYAIWQEGALNG